MGVVLFEGFELLDVFGPLEMFGTAPEHFKIQLVAENEGEIASGQGPKAVANQKLDAAGQFDIVLVPGGIGTRKEIENKRLLGWIRQQSKNANYVTSVCTGSALLACSGVLDGIKATTNKGAFQWVASQRPEVDWQKQARWVEDGKYFTSSGVSAGMDMSLALIRRILGQEIAEHIALHAEYEWHSDPSWDPFAKIHGLI